MERSDFSIIADRIASYLIVFILSAIAALSIKAGFYLSILIAAAFTTALFCVFKLLRVGERQKQNRKQKKLTSLLMGKLMFCPDGGLQILFETLLQKHRSAEISHGGVLIKNKKRQEVLIVPRFGATPLSESDVLLAVRSAKSCGAVIAVLLCENSKASAAVFAAKSVKPKVFILKNKKVFELFNACKFNFERLLASATPEKKRLKAKMKHIVSAIFNRSRSKGFMLGGFGLIVASVIAPLFAVFYRITGCLLLVIALICLNFSENREISEVFNVSIFD